MKDLARDLEWQSERASWIEDATKNLLLHILR